MDTTIRVYSNEEMGWGGEDDWCLKKHFWYKLVYNK